MESLDAFFIYAAFPFSSSVLQVEEMQLHRHAAIMILAITSGMAFFIIFRLESMAEIGLGICECRFSVSLVDFLFGPGVAVEETVGVAHIAHGRVVDTHQGVADIKGDGVKNRLVHIVGSLPDEI